MDNFLDKATFSCYILTQKNHKAFCGGLLMDSSFNSTTNLWLWHWELTQNVPTYLASVAVGNYLTQIKKYTNATRTIDMVWGIRPKDSATTKIAFANLTQTLAGFEKCYGNYHFDRVGYVYVPFYGGAMEHATNIAFPPYGFAGKTYESTAAHELSHHWWGDYMTCSSAEDMWLNEGWASYSERIFSENVYGKKAYQDEVRKNHYNVLRFAHHYDKGYHPLTPMPQTFTYGGTVYWKGADVAHSLRGYLGDSLFFKGIKGFLDDFAFKSASSADFKTSLNKHTGKDLTDFFAGWVYAAGFPHFALDSIGISPAGADYKIEVKISQQLKKAPSIYKNTPIEIITIFEDGTMDKNSVLMQDSLAAFTFTKKKKPITAIVDMDAKLSDATTKEYKTIYATGKYSYTESLMDVTVNTINFKDTATLFIAHHWVGAKHGKNLPLYAKISPQRYWTVDGYLPNGFTAKATIGYDGKVGTDFTIGFLDDELIDKTEDSLHLLYRRYPQDDWQEHPDYTKIMGAKTNKTGSITINKLLLGEYTLAMSPKVVIAIEETTGFDTYFKIYPNPAKDFIRIENLGNQKIQSATLLNLKGQIISTVKFSGTEITGLKTINTGIYFVKIETAQGSFVKMLVVE
ncbi:MAG: M1 family aminopeptidase [Bacteroidetes bacterium]|nr:M1 family aminopeptidase [Bacteroidota bacterium]